MVWNGRREAPVISKVLPRKVVMPVSGAVRDAESAAARR